jgi:hypothetical protein
LGSRVNVYIKKGLIECDNNSTAIKEKIVALSDFFRWVWAIRAYTPITGLWIGAGVRGIGFGVVDR